MDFTQKDLINVKERFAPAPIRKPKPDETISRIVGKTIYATDPRLLKLIVKWKAGKKQDDTRPDDFLRYPEKIKELKQALGGTL